jgi:hypothetical protein
MSMTMANPLMRKRALTLGVSALTLLVLYSCTTLRGGAVEARAVDAETGKPITNGIAYGVWDGVLASRRTNGNCIWAESARLDDHGSFRLPAWSKFDLKAPLTSDVQRSVFVYAPGYRLKLISDGEFPQAKLSRFTGSIAERFDELAGVISPCVPFGSERRVSAVYRMIAEELSAIAATSLQRQQADSMRSSAKSAKADSSKPTKRDDFGRVVNINPADEYPE